MLSTLSTKSTEIENEILDSNSFITTPACNRLKFDARIRKTVKKFTTKREIKNAHDLGEKNREKVKSLKSLIEVISLVKVILKMMKHKIIYCLKQFLSIFYAYC